MQKDRLKNHIDVQQKSNKLQKKLQEKVKNILDKSQPIDKDLVTRLDDNENITVYGDGLQKRCFSYIDDCLDCMEKCITLKKTSKQIINIGPDEEVVTIKELAELCANEVGHNKEPIYVDNRPQEVKFATCSANKSRKLLDYKTQTKLKDAISKTCEFIKKKGVKEFKYYLPVEIKNDKTPKTWTDKLI